MEQLRKPVCLKVHVQPLARARGRESIEKRGAEKRVTRRLENRGARWRVNMRAVALTKVRVRGKWTPRREARPFLARDFFALIHGADIIRAAGKVDAELVHAWAAEWMARVTPRSPESYGQLRRGRTAENNIALLRKCPGKRIKKSKRWNWREGSDSPRPGTRIEFWKSKW